MDKPLTQILSDPARRRNLEARYWPKVKRAGETDCWLWQAKARHPYGYGRMTAGRRIQLKAHQIGWVLANGPIPDGMSVLHKCDNPACSNPSHLFLGSQKDNMGDAVRKGRASAPPHSYGENHHNARLTNIQANEVAVDKRPARLVAADYGISEKTVYRYRAAQWPRGRLHSSSCGVLQLSFKAG